MTYDPELMRLDPCNPALPASEPDGRVWFDDIVDELFSLHPSNFHTKETGPDFCDRPWDDHSFRLGHYVCPDLRIPGYDCPGSQLFDRDFPEDSIDIPHWHRG